MNTTDEKERMRRAVWGLYSETRGLHPAVLPSDVRPIRVERALDILLEHKDENRGSRRRRAVLEAGAANLHQHSRPGIADRRRHSPTGSAPLASSATASASGSPPNGGAGAGSTAARAK